jgi:hypothetical protein
MATRTNDITFDDWDRLRVYWNISSAMRGRSAKPMTTEMAFRQMNRVFEITDPNNPIVLRLHKLREEIIRGPEHEDVLSESAKQA